MPVLGMDAGAARAEQGPKALHSNTAVLQFVQKQMVEKLEERLNILTDKSLWETDQTQHELTLRNLIAQMKSLDFEHLEPVGKGKKEKQEQISEDEAIKMSSQPPSNAPSPTTKMASLPPSVAPSPTEAAPAVFNQNPDEHAKERLSKRAGSSRQARINRPASFKSPLHKKLAENDSKQLVVVPSLSTTPLKRSPRGQDMEKALKDGNVSQAVFGYLDSQETLGARLVCKAWNGAMIMNSVASHAFTHSEKGLMYQVLSEREKKFRVSDILSKQPQVNSHMRSILVDWIIDVCHEFRHTDDTLHLAVKLVDRLLQTVAVPRKELQLVGCAAILLAAKVEEVLSVRVDDLLYLCDHQYSRDELLQMEGVLLDKLQYQFSCPTALSFIQFFWNHFTFSSKSHNISHFCLELSLENVPLMQAPPSQLATASACLALHNDNQPYELLLAVTGYSATEITKLMQEIATMCERQRKAWELRSDKDADTLLQTTMEKFCASEKDSVSKLQLQAPTTA